MQNYKVGNSHASGSSGAFFTGLVVGGLLGAGSMLLLAPQSGKETRGQIQGDGIELFDQVTETVGGAAKQARSTGLHMAADLRKEGKNLQKRGRAALKDQVEIASQFVEDEEKAVKEL